jgi:hypothetical protein
LKELERAPAETFERAVQILALLQRDGRLVDFLAGNISPYPDVQLGAAAPAMRCFNGWEIIEDLAVRARKSHETASRRQDHHALRLRRYSLQFILPRAAAVPLSLQPHLVSSPSSAPPDL